jgi:tetratricopeptide (TPR) repeat protein
MLTNPNKFFSAAHQLGTASNESNQSSAAEELASLARHAQLAREQSDWARACVLYQQALHIDDKRADWWHHFGLCLVGLGQHAKAIMACQRALYLEPRLWQSQILIAQSQAAQGEPPPRRSPAISRS